MSSIVVLVMSNDQKPWFDPELCPTGMETAKQSQLEEANEQVTCNQILSQCNSYQFI